MADNVIKILNKTHEYAKQYSECCKAQVASAIISVKGDKCIALEANTTLPYSCKVNGCHRIKVYGEDSKNHRLPSDCYAIHSEVKAIASAARRFETTIGSTIYVTRYPCEACARAIVAAGIKHVVYAGKAKISEQTEQIFMRSSVEVTHVVLDWGDDNER